MKRVLIIFAVLLVCGAIAVFMPPSLDNPVAYPELNKYARPFPWEVQVLMPGELCDDLSKTLHDNFNRFVTAPRSERPGIYDLMLDTRAELTKYGCTEP